MARHYGARPDGLIDGWLVHDESDSAAVEELSADGIETRAVPLLMTDVPATAAMAAAALALAESVRR